MALATWATAGSARTADQRLRVAIVIPKSGPFEIHNRLLANGAAIAADEIDAGGAVKGQNPVRLKLKVVRVGPTAAPGRIVRTLARGSIRVVVLPCNIELQESLARAVAKAGLLTLSPCNPDPQGTQTVSRSWQVGATGQAEAGQLVYLAHSRLRAKTAFLLGTAGSWYSRQMTGELRQFAKRDKIRIVGAASVSSGAHGVTGLAQRIRKSNPAVVFATVPSPQIESIVTQLRKKGVVSAFFATDGMDAAINFFQYRNGPDNSSLEQVVFATFGFPRTTSSSGTFYRDYAAAYGRRPVGSFPGLGYETVRVLESAARRAASLTPAGLNASFARGFTLKGVVLEDTTYLGHSHRQPVTSVGIAEIIRDRYVSLFTSVAGHPTG